MYHNILIPIVFDSEHRHERARAAAASLSAPDAKITFLHVLETLPTYVVAYIPEQASERLRAEMNVEMQSLIKDIPGARGEIINGHSGRAIIDFASKNLADLIIVESHRPGFGDYFLGSTAAYIVRRASCAVHVIK